VVLSEDLKRYDQGKGSEVQYKVSEEESLAIKELKLVLEVKGIAGLSCDGQEGKLTDVLG
jgi:hypothetical protein